MKLVTSLSLSALGLTALAIAAAPPGKYPESRRVNQTDDYFGTTVADPYRWLEDDNASDTQAWVKAQNDVTFGYLDTIPQRKAIRDRITSLWNFEKYTTPGKEGGKYFYGYNTGLQNQNVLYVTDAIDAKARVLLDPNTWTTDGTAAIAGTDVSDDGRLLAFGIADKGSDWVTWRVRDIATGKDMADEVRWCKFSNASWTHDAKGFFYSRFDKPADGKALTGSNKYHKLYFHALGTNQDKDILVYSRDDQPDWGFAGVVTDDGRYLALNVSHGTDKKNRFFYRDLQVVGIDFKPTDADKAVREAEATVLKNTLRGDEPPHIAEVKRKAVADAATARAERVKAAGGVANGFVELLNDFDASYDFIDNVGTTFYFLNDLMAPRNQVLAIDITKPDRANWKVIVPQSDATLVSASIVGDHIVCNYLKDAASQVKVYDLSGKFVRDVALPGIGTASGFGGRRSDPETFYSFASFTTPPSIYRYDVKTGLSTLFKAAKVDFNPADYEVKQVFYSSKDGTKVPMFIAHKKGLTLDGNNPTLLYGYGGFNIPMTPNFSISNLVWMEMGGVYAVANLRGGGEYGEDWHQAGMKLKKQNVFDDFIAAGEWLIASKYTQPKKLAIFGGSNGGLLVGACMTQRPDLFGAAIPAVGVMDMLRFHKFTIGHAWRSDYGSSEESAEQFAVLHGYSPYHALLRAKPGTRFPATMVTTADHDDRVVPGHSFKFAAALQAAGAPDGAVNPANPLLIRIDTSAGHGAGKPTAKQIEERADIFAFLVKNLDFKPTLKPALEPQK